MPVTIELRPSAIRRSVRPGERYTETLVLRNVGDDRFGYEISAEPTYRAWVDPDPERFAINAGDDRSVTLNLLPPGNAKIGLHQFRVNVVNDDDAADTAAVDVALRVPIPVLWWVMGALAVLAILLIILWQVGVF